MRRWKAHRGKIASLSFSRDGRLLASVSGSGRESFIWNALTGEVVRTPARRYEGDRRPILCSTFSPVADLFVVLHYMQVELWDTAGWVRLGDGPSSATNGEVAVLPTVPPRVTVSGAGGLEIHELPAGAHRLVLVSRWQVGFIPRFDVAASGSVAALHRSNRTAVYAVPSGVLLAEVRHPEGEYAGPVRFSPDSSRLVFFCTNTIESHPATLDDPRDVIRCVGHTNKVWVLRYTPDGRSLVSASSDGTVRVWEAATGLQKQCFEMNVGKLAAADVSPDGTTAAVGGVTGEIVVWDLE